MHRLPLPETAGLENLSNRVEPAAHLVTVSPQPERIGETSFDKIDGLVAYAVANNPQIAVARFRADVLISRVPQVQSLEDPQVTTTAFLHAIETAAGPQDLALSLSQKIPWFGKLACRGNVAHNEAQAAYQDLAAVELNVIEQVKLAYLELYFLARAIEVNRQLQPRLKDVVEITRTKYQTNAQDTGLESVLQAEVALARLRTTMVELEQAEVRARAQLAQAIHLPDGAEIVAPKELEISLVPERVHALLGMIEVCHPQLEARRYEIARDQAAVGLAQRNYYPDFKVVFNWYAIGSEGLSPFATGDDAYSIGVGLNLPIYLKRLNATLDEAQFKLAESCQNYQVTWDTAFAEVKQLHARATEHDRVLRILETEILPKARQTLDLSIEAFRLGRIGFQQMIDNYEDYLRYEIDYHMRKTRREQAVASLERAVGCAVAHWPVGLQELPSTPPLPEPR
jgi:outer membrane protein TolC